MKSAIKLCHPARAFASLCATVSKRHRAGSSEGISPDLLTALCLRGSVADLSSRPEPGIHSGFSNKMINNNNPPRQREGGRERQRLASGRRVLWAGVLSALQSRFPSSLTLAVPHLKFPLCISSEGDSLCDATCKHRCCLTPEDHWLLHVLHWSDPQTQLLHYSVRLYWENIINTYFIFILALL